MFLTIRKLKRILLGENNMLSKEKRRELLTPIYEEYKKENINFCSYYDVDYLLRRINFYLQCF